ncbi:MAG: ABC transporter ATP-binding protein [Acholeplasmatales bacterium]|nr:ABC transporter ATP-binding protein [Acholeplasmatales bacterium]
MMQGTDVVKIYDNGQLKVKAVKGMTFTIKKGELVVILGQSGAGKSTLLNLIGGMDYVTEGSLVIGGKDIAKYSPKELIDFRRNDIGFVFQFYNLMPNLTAKENVELACELKKDALDPVQVLESVGLGDKVNNFPAQLSGGEQQRVSIARAIAKNADIILCDEPTGALDYETGKEILALLAKQAREYKKTVIIVTHNSALAEMCDHLIRVKNGLIALDVYNENPKDIKDIEW